MEELFNQSDEDLLALIKEQSELTDELSAIGKHSLKDGISRFTNIRSEGFVPLTYVGRGNPQMGKNVQIQLDQPINLPDEWFRFKLKLADKNSRIERKNPTLLTVDLTQKIERFNPDEKEFVVDLYSRKANKSREDEKNEIQQLTVIEREINRVEDAFVFELFQNADDYPVDGEKVDVFISTSSESLTFSHTGSEFRFNNVYAICNVSDGDKQADFDKIGYKGIGFKSVFAYADYVLIKSGAYQFKFDKNHIEFQREKPFQTIPIWVDDESLRDLSLLDKRVNFLIHPIEKERKIESWLAFLKGIFSENNNTPVILFLKNIDNVYINNSLVSSASNNWVIDDFTFKVSPELQEYVRVQFQNNTGNIPEKLLGVSEGKIQFAFKQESNGIEGIEESILYNYLPTKVGLGFPFLINSDFIPTGDRRDLVENNWNKELIQEAGSIFFQWLSLVYQFERSKGKSTYQYLSLLPDVKEGIERLAKISSSNLFLLESFKIGFEKALLGTEMQEQAKFILTKDDTLESLGNIVIDLTGISGLPNFDFQSNTGRVGKLISRKIGPTKISDLVTEYNAGLIYNQSMLKADLAKESFQLWLKVPENNMVFLAYVVSNAELKEMLKEKVALTNKGTLAPPGTLYGNIPTSFAFINLDTFHNDSILTSGSSDIAFPHRTFELKSFLKSEIIGKEENVNKLIDNEEKSISFWRYIISNWVTLKEESNIKTSLKKIKVLVKSEDEDSKTTKFRSISDCYLSKEFDEPNEIESILQSLQLDDTVYISPNYIGIDIEAKDALIIFKNLGITSDLQKLIAKLIEQLDSKTDDQHLLITKELFKYWKKVSKDNLDVFQKSQLDKIRTALRLKCTSSVYETVEGCIISDYYNLNQKIAETLPAIELENLISREYALLESQIPEWKRFFKYLGVEELDTAQEILDAKLSFYVTNQVALQRQHYVILKDIDQLFTNRSTNKLSFNLLGVLLESDTLEKWMKGNELHFTDDYLPKLKLEKDSNVSYQFSFLNNAYKEYGISKNLLKDIGVQEGFVMKLEGTINIGRFTDTVYLFNLKSLPNYISRLAEIRKMTTRGRNGHNERTYTDEKINYNTFVKNHITLNYSKLLSTPKYAGDFLSYLLKHKQLQDFPNETTIAIWGNNNYHYKNRLTDLLFNVSFIKTQNKELNSPSNLYSLRLQAYVDDLARLPLVEYAKFPNFEKVEDFLHFTKTLNTKDCIRLLSRKKNRLKIEEIENLGIIGILKGHAFTEAELAQIKVLNTEGKWKSPSKVFTVQDDENFEIKNEYVLHNSFQELKEELQIKELSEESLTLQVTPARVEESDDITVFFADKAKYLAFKISPENYIDLEEQLIETFEKYQFFEYDKIVYIFPEANPIYTSNETKLLVDPNAKIVRYVGFWKSNIELIDLLLEIINSDRLDKKWFNNLISRYTDENIKAYLNEHVAKVPDEWLETQQDDGQAEETNEGFDDEEEMPSFSENEKQYLTDAEQEEFLKLFGKEIPENHKKDINLAACVSALVHFNNCKWDVLQAEVEFTDKHKYAQISPVVSPEGTVNTVMCRSARRGILYLTRRAWDFLSEKGIRLYIKTGNAAEDYIIFDSQDEILRISNTQFQVFRVEAKSSLNNTDDFLTGNFLEKDKIWLLFKVSKNAEYNSIFGEKQYDSDFNTDDIATD